MWVEATQAVVPVGGPSYNGVRLRKRRRVRYFPRSSGRVYAGDRLTADAEGLFVAVDRERFMRLFEERERRERERSAGPATGDEPT